MTIKQKAFVQTLIFLALQAGTLFAAAGRINIVELWLYVAVWAVICVLSLAILDTDLVAERMRPGGRRQGLRFLPITLALFLHWAVAGLDRGRLHISDNVPPALQIAALILFAAAWLLFVWAMRVNRFFSSIPRIQSERGHQVISSGPYRLVRHPGYTAGIVAAVTSGIALGSWLSTFIAPIAIALLVWRTTVEDTMLQRNLPGYTAYVARVRYRLIPGIW